VSRALQGTTEARARPPRPDELPARWQEEAEFLRANGAVEAAVAKSRAAIELAEAIQMYDLEQLTVSQAAEESGVSQSQLRRRFPGQRTIRRADLPRKGKRGGLDLAGEILRKAGR
jgi:predicted DNA-binding protein (UPF0251 family)